MKKIVLVSLFTVAALFSCKKVTKNDAEIKKKEVNVSVNKSDVTEKLSDDTKSKEFSWSDISESNVDIGDYPYIKPPRGMTIDKNSCTKSYDFHKLIMFNGSALFEIEGRVDMMSIKANNEESWNQLLFDKSVTLYLESIGAKLISDTRIPDEFQETFGKTYEEINNYRNEYTICSYDEPLKMFVLKTPTKKIGFQVYSNSATGEIGIVEMKKL